MRPLRYSINVTLDGCCDHQAIPADEELHRHATENLNRADALLFGRVTYEMMEAAFRSPAPAEARPEWMEPFARTIDAARKYVISSTWPGRLHATFTRRSFQAVSTQGEPVKGLVVEGESPVAWRIWDGSTNTNSWCIQARRPWTNPVRGAPNTCRPEACWPPGVPSAVARRMSPVGIRMRNWLALTASLRLSLAPGLLLSSGRLICLIAPSALRRQ